MTVSLNFDAPFLEGQTAIVTGASAGLGRHFARLLARRGAKVGLIARGEDKLRVLADEIESHDGRALPVPADVSDPVQVAHAVETIADELGAPTVLVNNAGVTVVEDALELTPEDWQRILATNLSGAWYVAQAVAKRMAAHGAGGSIVNISSILAGRGSRGLHSYCASKAGLEQMTRVLALEWGRLGIRVNALAPGYLLTDMARDFLTSPAAEPMIKRIPTRRLGEPEDLDGPLLLLVSEASRHMTGAVIAVDGGHAVSAI
ncbi:MAG: SDR family NAD(P)-dependent oxidoreductase [Alphaproteobacteria bacterium]